MLLGTHPLLPFPQRQVALELHEKDLKFFQSEVHRAIQSQSFRTLTFGPTGPSLYAVNEHYIKPVTAAAGHMSWALMMNPGGLDCDLFITHAWQEDVFEFTEKVLASWPWRARHAWCCMLAIPQHLDIAALLRTPSSSPFAFALQSSKYMLVVPNRYTSVYTRLWCGYEAYLAFQSNKVIRTATPPVLRQVLCAWFRMLPALLIGIVVGLVTRMDQFRSALKLVMILKMLALLANLLSQNCGHIRICLIANHIGLASGTATVLGSNFQARFPVPPLSKELNLAVDRYARVCIVLYFLLAEGDRVNWRLEKHEAEELQNNYQGSLRHASCSYIQDEVNIRNEIGGHVDEVDKVIQVLLKAGMSSDVLREAYLQGVQVRHAGVVQLAIPLIVLGPQLLLGCWHLVGFLLLLHTGPGYATYEEGWPKPEPLWFITSLQASSIFARIGFIALLCRGSIDERCFMLNTMAKTIAPIFFVELGLLTFEAPAAFVSLVGVYHLSFVVVLAFAALGIRGTLRLPGGRCLAELFLSRVMKCDGRSVSAPPSASASSVVSTSEELSPSASEGSDSSGEEEQGEAHEQPAKTRYLRDLGITTLALSSIFLDSAGEYQGSCTTDLTSIDPNFGNKELLRELVHDAHSLGLKVVLDVQVNHACGKGLKYLGSNNNVDGVNLCVQSSVQTYWTKERGGNLNEYVRGRLGFGDALPAFLRHQSFFLRCGSAKLYRPDGKDFTKLPPENATAIEGGLLFPEIFQDDYFELNTMDPVLQELYTNMLKYWIAEADVDGYRITAASHVTADFTAYLSTHLRFYATALGKENFFIVGEVNQANTPFGGSYLGRVQGNMGPKYLPKKVQGVLEELCPYYSALSDQQPGFLSSYPLQEVYHVRESVLGYVDAMGLYKSYAQKAVNRSREALESQGQIRLALNAVESKNFRKLLSNPSQGHELWRLMVAMAWSFTWYGIPDLAQGTEQGLNGLCYRNDQEREDLQKKMEDQGIEGKVVTMIMEECNYQVLGAQTDSGFWHQDSFQGGPLRLGSAVAGVNDQMGILDHLMGAAGPHWCEDPVLDRDNEAYRMAQALIRIRRSCYALRTQLDSPAPTGEGRATQLAYWKLHDGREDMAIEEQPLGMLVVLSMIPSLEDQPDQPERKYLLPEGLEYNEGQEFVDLLHPTRTGTIVAEANGGLEAPQMLVMRVAEVRGQNFAKLNPPEVEALPSDASGGDDQHGWCVMQNGRGAMEDAVDVQGRFFAVYDGHGGSEAVSYVKEALPKLLGKEKGPDMGLRMKEAFQKADAALLDHLQRDEADVLGYPLSSGVCACIAVRDEHELAVANLGDCRALAYKGGSLIVMTKEHKPCEPCEKERLSMQGIQTTSDGYLPGGLSVSRALGDFTRSTWTKCPGLLSEPEVTVFSVDSDMEFILLASDGTRSPQAAAEALLKQAQKLKSTDNLSALVVVFRMPPAEASNSSLGRKVLLKGLDA
ncbi:Probable protein phosphatase 2C 22 (AtPP2C22) [Durusdinium trenchii]|uniref:Probable protein phosphatase 2C 22 (AtPP2C22) n=1 Tax=Durusdinium trenchii TaxID=1381693 RepID=A0ABP0HEH6_9DINO